MIELILAIAIQVGVPVDIAVAVAKAESSFKATAVHVNANGTEDYGIMQLNSASLPIFIEQYWDKPETFDVFNAEHNIYVGLKYLKYLLSIETVDLGGWPVKWNEFQALCAYNAGEYAVKSGKVPSSAVTYAHNIMKEVYK